jgi:hypothetical protein
VSEFLQGATMLASVAVALFFLRFWRQTSDRLFAVFAAAFGVFAVNRLLLAVLDENSETRNWVYALRAATFLMIAVAVLDKNVRRDSA